MKPWCPGDIFEESTWVAVKQRYIPLKRNVETESLLLSVGLKTVKDFDLNFRSLGKLLEPWLMILGWMGEKDTDTHHKSLNAIGGVDVLI